MTELEAIKARHSVRKYTDNPIEAAKIAQLRAVNTKPNNTIMKEQVLKAMREAGKPVSAGDVTKALNADRKEVDKAFAELKKEGSIVSPVRCKWEPAK